MRMMLALAGALALAAGAPAHADYPDRPIRLVVPFAAGGTVDIIARIVGARLSEMVGQPVVVDNRGGAGGVIGTELVAHAAGDGYTVLLHSAAIASDAALHRDLPYDTTRDLAPVGMIGTTANVLVAAPGFAARSAADVIGLARARPGVVTVANGGIGSASHLAAVLFGAQARVTVTHVPYKGAAPALGDVVGRHVDLMIATLPGALPHIRAQRLAALGVSSLTRADELPDVPPIAESGLPGYDYTVWFGVFAPGTTQAPVIARLNFWLNDAVGAADTAARLIAQGVAPRRMDPAAFRAAVAAELARWQALVEQAGITATP
ncbi:MAG: tripartite tricarboxylate transporter substrate binding protein [Proteobacteria bacterium]|nr:tripartite tricarboxylate transporter substrate binding protein [Pseudomonadota bacterium]